jgi:hypothetical protein
VAENLRVVLDEWANLQDAWIVPLPLLDDTPNLNLPVALLKLADGSFTGVLS